MSEEKKRFYLYVHGDKSGACDQLRDQGFSESNAQGLRYASYEHKITYEWHVDGDGDYHTCPVALDDIEIPKVEPALQSENTQLKSQVAGLREALKDCYLYSSNYSIDPMRRGKWKAALTNTEALTQGGEPNETTI
jgi:hypothetical protein